MLYGTRQPAYLVAAFLRVRSLEAITGAVKHKADDGRAEKHPKELIPVEERDTPQRGRVAGVKSRCQQSEVWQKQEQPNARMAAARSLWWGRRHVAFSIADGTFAVIGERFADRCVAF